MQFTAFRKFSDLRVYRANFSNLKGPRGPKLPKNPCICFDNYWELISPVIPGLILQIYTSLGARGIVIKKCQDCPVEGVFNDSNLYSVTIHYADTPM